MLAFSGNTSSSLLSARSYCCLPQRSWPANIQTFELPRQGSGNVHAARERPCDITREYNRFRYFALGRLFGRFPHHDPTCQDPHSWHLRHAETAAVRNNIVTLKLVTPLCKLHVCYKPSQGNIVTPDSLCCQ